ncbi:MAG: NAD-dependent epimerase/dehydratase family protein [Deltaproteobacteria bacterium]|nr:NAD-dependent epimerase/dehydratase family protein [Deltaproteobacteria bacterium]
MKKSSEEGKVLVTGGGGFLGSAICRQLIRKGYQVRSFSRNIYPELVRAGVECLTGDMRCPEDLKKAVSGCDTVIHSAAKAGIWGKPEDFMDINYKGTLSLLNASKQAGVRRFIYTSSPSVVFGNQDIRGADESLPYPQKFYSWYACSKRHGEAAVLAAHQGAEFCTLALRPHLIWGPGDPHFLPRLKMRADAHRLFRLGSGDNLVDVTYVENAAAGHLAALLAMSRHHFTGGGRAYFLAQDEPVRLWDFLNKMLAAIGRPPVSQSLQIPFSIAWSIGFFIETIWKISGSYDKEPPLTRFAAMQLCRSHYFNHGAAQTQLGYYPEISTEDGLTALRQYSE